MLAFVHAHAWKPHILPPPIPNTTDDDGAAGAQGGGADDEDGEGGDKVEDDAGLLRPYTDVPWHRKGGLVTVTSSSSTGGGGGAGQVRERMEGGTTEGEGRG